MYSDSIADMLTRIRNSYMAKRSQVLMPHSKMKESIAVVLKDNNYIKDFKVTKDGVKKTLEITLDYPKGEPAISHIKRISKSGLKIYRKKGKLPHVLSGMGIAIISTSKGLMTDKQARKQALGGEIICQIW